MPEFDVVVLGAGTSGLLIATEAARSGRSVAVVEAGLVGGESPYLACLPSKSMLHSARSGQTWEHAVARREEVAARLDDSSAAARLAACGVTLLRGLGRVSSAGVVEVAAAGECPPRSRSGKRPGPAAGSGARAPGDGPTGDRLADDGLAGDGLAGDGPGDAGPGGDARPGDGPGGPEEARPGAASPGGGARARGASDGGAVILRYRDLVVATGSEPIAPPIEGLADVPIWTSAEALSRPQLPRRLIVLGAGQIGCELAQMYAAFGAQVTLVEAEPQVLPDEPPFVGQILADALRRAGADLRLGSAAVKAEALDHGLALILADGTRLEADRVLLAAGRRPRASRLGLGVLGAAISPAGALAVDGECRALAAPAGGRPARQAGDGHLWAAGDVTGAGPYAHVARYQAGVVAANLLGGHRTANYLGIPRVVHTWPSVCCVGLTPGPAAQSAGVSLRAGGWDLSEISRAVVDGDDRGRVELYADTARDDVLVGAAAIGPHAEEWMGEVALAVRARLTLAVLADMARPHPAYGEAIERALRELADGASGGSRG